MKNVPISDSSHPRVAASAIDSSTIHRGRAMRVVERSLVEHALERAVLAGVHSQFPGLAEKVTRRVCEEARAAFAREIEGRGRRALGVSRKRFLAELERSREAALAARERARVEIQELERQKRTLAELSAGVQREQARQSEAAVDGFLDSFRRDLRSLLRGLSDAGSDRGTIEERVIELAQRSAAREREQSAEQLARELELKADVFERRIAKLSGELAQAEAMLAELATMNAGDPGIASIFKTAQGLASNEAFAAMKRRILVQVFRENVELQSEQAKAA